jgi:hypothetical protein
MKRECLPHERYGVIEESRLDKNILEGIFLS